MILSWDKLSWHYRTILKQNEYINQFSVYPLDSDITWYLTVNQNQTNAIEARIYKIVLYKWVNGEFVIFADGVIEANDTNSMKKAAIEWFKPYLELTE